MPKRWMLFLLVPALLSGCVTTKKGDQEVILTKEEMAAALKNSREPGQFGYLVGQVQGGVAVAAVPRLHPTQMAVMPFKAEGQPVVEVHGKSNREKINLLIDTSSAVSWMEFNASQEMNATFLELDDHHVPYRGSAAIGPVRAYAAAIPQLRFHQLFIEDAAVFVRMARNTIGPLDREIKDPKVDAVLGYDMLKNFGYIRFDFQNEEVVLSATEAYVPNKDLLIGSAPIIGNQLNVGLLIEGSIDSEKVPLLLDFSGDYFFLKKNVTTPLTGVIALGDVVYADTPTGASPFPDGFPRVGARMLKEYVVTVCPSTRFVYFERPDY